MALFRRKSRVRIAKAGICLTIIFLSALLLAIDSSSTPNIAPRQDYADIASLLRPFIEQQMAEKHLPALSIAIVDDQQIVWAEGFGFADPKKKIPATAETTYRIGSVSKLFTDIGIMQLVESGQLNLDAPIAEYLPEFHPKNPFHKPSKKSKSGPLGRSRRSLREFDGRVAMSSPSRTTTPYPEPIGSRS